VIAGLSVAVLLVLIPGSLRSRRFWASHGSHLGLAVIVLGVAVSGPFQRSHELALSPGESFDFSGYGFTYAGLGTADTPGQEITRTEEARITVSRDGKPVGVLTPQRLTYRNYDHPPTEVSTVSGLGDELYATAHDLDGERLTPLKVSVNPMVNWVWIGSIMVCTLPLLAIRRKAGPTSPKGGAA